MGPLQVLCITVDEPLYDGQMCLAQKFTNIVWQVLFSVITSLSKQRTSDIVWQVLRTDTSFGPSGEMGVDKLCITRVLITYIMLNGLERITYDRITCEILYVYITI
jgi:hypothetical protein